MDKKLTYGDKDKFQDPVLRCDSCNKLVLSKDLFRLGVCPECGNRKVRKVLLFKEEEFVWMREQGIDPEFFKEFESVPEVGDVIH